jgi:hypothetical protein
MKHNCPHTGQIPKVAIIIKTQDKNVKNNNTSEHRNHCANRQAILVIIPSLPLVVGMGINMIQSFEYQNWSFT